MAKILAIDSDKVLAAAKQCPDAKAVLKTLFPEVFTDPYVDFNESTSLKLKNGLTMIETRKGTSNFVNTSLYLHSGHEWEIVMDSSGVAVLRARSKTKCSS